MPRKRSLPNTNKCLVKLCKMNKLKIAAIQLNLVQCTSEIDFYNLLDSLVQESVNNGAKVICFPEDLGFCLAWAKDITNIASRSKTQEKSA